MSSLFLLTKKCSFLGFFGEDNALDLNGTSTFSCENWCFNWGLPKVPIRRSRQTCCAGSITWQGNLQVWCNPYWSFESKIIIIPPLQTPDGRIHEEVRSATQAQAARLPRGNRRLILPYTLQTTVPLIYRSFLAPCQLTYITNIIVILLFWSLWLPSFAP